MTEYQQELRINYCKLVVISTDSPECSAAFRAGLGSTFLFLSDQNRTAVKQLDMIETSEKHGVTAMPYTFALLPDLTVHKIYCGYWYVGRATVEEMRQDFRAMMKICRPDFDHQA